MVHSDQFLPPKKELPTVLVLFMVASPTVNNVIIKYSTGSCYTRTLDIVTSNIGICNDPQEDRSVA